MRLENLSKEPVVEEALQEAGFFSKAINTVKDKAGKVLDAPINVPAAKGQTATYTTKGGKTMQGTTLDTDPSNKSSSHMQFKPEKGGTFPAPKSGLRQQTSLRDMGKALGQVGKQGAIALDKATDKFAKSLGAHGRSTKDWWEVVKNEIKKDPSDSKAFDAIVKRAEVRLSGINTKEQTDLEAFEDYIDKKYPRSADQKIDELLPALGALAGGAIGQGLAARAGAGAIGKAIGSTLGSAAGGTAAAAVGKLASGDPAANAQRQQAVNDQKKQIQDAIRMKQEEIRELQKQLTSIK